MTETVISILKIFGKKKLCIELMVHILNPCPWKILYYTPGKFHNICKVIWRNILISIKELLRKYIACLHNIWTLGACHSIIAVFCKQNVFFNVCAEVKYRAASEGV